MKIQINLHNKESEAKMLVHVVMARKDTQRGKEEAEALKAILSINPQNISFSIVPESQEQQKECTFICPITA